MTDKGSTLPSGAALFQLSEDLTYSRDRVARQLLVWNPMLVRFKNMALGGASASGGFRAASMRRRGLRSPSA